MKGFGAQENREGRVRLIGYGSFETVEAEAAVRGDANKEAAVRGDSNKEAAMRGGSHLLSEYENKLKRRFRLSG